MKKSREKIKPSNVTTLACGALVAMVVLYLYFLNMSVVEVVVRTEFIQTQNDLNTEIALLESEFIQAKHQVSAKLASLEGYEDESLKIFVERGAPSLVLGSNQ
jgi:hypothetical protein